MTRIPGNPNEVAALLREANASRASVGPVDLSRLNRVLDYTPEDMTVTVEAGLHLGELQRVLRKQNQWLPLDPAHGDSLAVSDLIGRNVSGPRRLGFGTVRDHLIGVQVALADGRLVRSGGKVVKNVAGFDVLKLFVGAEGSLGVIVEAAFKLLPVPETERFVQRRCRSLDEAVAAIQRVLGSSLSPSVLDWHGAGTTSDTTVVIGFSGAREDVEVESNAALNLGFVEEATLDYEEAFWSGTKPVGRESVLPGRIGEAVRQLGEFPFVARAGNGLVHHRGPRLRKDATSAAMLARRVKEAFDPNGILPSMPES